MTLALLFFGAIALFHREILFGLLVLQHKAKSMSFGISGSKRGRFQLMSSPQLSEGLISFSSLFGLVIIVDEALWDSWSSSEQQAVVLWSFAAAQRRSTWGRLLRPGEPQLIDRDSLLFGASSIDLISALQTLEAQRRQPLAVGPSIWSGLSPLGPSWIGTWPTLSERISALSRSSIKLF
jgi:hypothetical protein